MKPTGVPHEIDLPAPVNGAHAVQSFVLRDGTILSGEYELVFVNEKGARYRLTDITCPTTVELRTRHDAVVPLVKGGAHTLENIVRRA